MKKPFVALENAGIEFKDCFLLQDISFILEEGELAVITGPSGSGKTLLGRLIAASLNPTHGKVILPDNDIVFVSQQHYYNTSPSSRSYYQQRYDSNYGENSPFVQNYLKQLFPDEETKIHSLLERFRLKDILFRRLIQLSNGEGKRLQILIALMRKPRLLVMDSPFTGVDKENRKELFRLFDFIRKQNITCVLIAQPDHIPSSTSQVLIMEEGRIKETSFNPSVLHNKISLKLPFQEENLPDQLYHNDGNEFSTAVKMQKVSIDYEGKTILSEIDWEVRRGECRLIRGANGSGRSMLLSLINGDNPKAFGKDIILFDKKKGSGESIWELKSRIGYVSPEMHLHFLRRPEHIVELIDRDEKNCWKILISQKSPAKK